MRVSLQVQLDELAQLIRSGERLVVLAGAGISMPAGIPGGRGVVERLKKAYPAALDSTRDYEYAEAFNLALPGEDNREERRIFFEELCAGIPPGEEHDWIGSLVDARVVGGVLTTNFDHLLDFSMMARCHRRPMIFMFEDELDPALVTATPTLTKLHGDFLIDDLANLPEEMRRRLDRNMHEKLRSCLTGAALLVLGYSGADESVMGFLSELASEPGVMTSVWWNIFSPSDRTPAVDSVVNAARLAGKTSEVIGPSPALEVLRGLGLRFGIAAPEPLPFGINAGIDNPREAFGHRFVALRHRPPSRRHALTFTQAALLDQVVERTTRPGWTWVLESAPLDEVVAYLATESSLVFDARRSFAPRDRALLEQFEIIGDLFDIPGAQSIDANEIITSVFRAGVLVIVMHPFRDPEDQMMDILARVLVGRERAGSGYLVVIDRSDVSLDALREHAARIDPDVEIPAPHTVQTNDELPQVPDDPAVSEALVRLAALRVAPSIDLFAALVNDATSCIAKLEDADVIRVEQNAIILAEGIRQEWRKHAGTEHHVALAGALEHAASVEAQHVRARLLVEAEYHWFQAGEYNRALQLLLTFGVPDTAARYFSARLLAWAPVLTDRIGRVTIGHSDALSLIRLCVDVINFAFPPIASAGEAAQAIINTLRERLTPVWNDLLQAEYAMHEEQYPLLRRAYVLAKEIGDDPAYLRAVRGMSAYWFAELLSAQRSGYRSAERALLFSREVVKRALQQGDHNLARSYGDNVVVALGALGRNDDWCRAARAQLREVARDEGLSYEKGVAYGNLFFSEMASGQFKSASGLLPESQLNFWYGNHLLGIIRNLQSLWRIAVRSPTASELPHPSDIYTVVVKIVSVGSCDDESIMELVEPMLSWSVDEARARGDVGAAVTALANWIRVRNATPVHSSTHAAFAHLYEWAGVVWFTFGEPAIDPLHRTVAKEYRHARSHAFYLDLLFTERMSDLYVLMQTQDSDRPELMRRARRDAKAYVEKSRLAVERDPSVPT